MQEQIILACSVCKRHNYSSTKNRRKVTAKIELSKFCKFCRKHTIHRQIK